MTAMAHPSQILALARMYLGPSSPPRWPLRSNHGSFALWSMVNRTMAQVTMVIE
jgi:hypothetical protein